MAAPTNSFSGLSCGEGHDGRITATSTSRATMRPVLMLAQCCTTPARLGVGPTADQQARTQAVSQATAPILQLGLQIARPPPGSWPGVDSTVGGEQ